MGSDDNVPQNISSAPFSIRHPSSNKKYFDPISLVPALSYSSAYPACFNSNTLFVGVSSCSLLLSPSFPPHFIIPTPPLARADIEMATVTEIDVPTGWVGPQYSHATSQSRSNTSTGCHFALFSSTGALQSSKSTPKCVPALIPNDISKRPIVEEEEEKDYGNELWYSRMEEGPIRAKNVVLWMKCRHDSRTHHPTVIGSVCSVWPP